MIACPGEVITKEGGYLRGHGTRLVARKSLAATSSPGDLSSSEDEGGAAAADAGGPEQEGILVATLVGWVERVNKLVSVRPPSSRYVGEVGDLVIGRVAEVGSRRWKVDIGAYQDAVLQLSSVNLPGGSQRKRTSQDQLEMRNLYVENDLISAEVQQINGSDGSVALHTRSLKYGKLENGRLVRVPQSQVRRLKQHFVTLTDMGVEVLIGTNGWVWVTRPSASTTDAADGDDILAPDTETLTRRRALHAKTPITGEDRQKIVRVCNAISHLGETGGVITPAAIVNACRRGEKLTAYAMLSMEEGGVRKDE